MDNQKAVEKSLNTIRVELIRLVAEVREMIAADDTNEEFIEEAVHFLEESADSLDKLHQLMYGRPTTT